MNWRSPLPSGHRRLRRAVLVVAAAPVLALAMVALPAATPAWAASCPSGYMCTWVNANYSGTQWNFPASASRLNYWWYVGNTPNDKISSIQERTSEFYDGWIGKDCPVGSDYTWIGTGASVPNLANDTWPDGTSLNDSISAWGISGNIPAHGSRTAGGC